MAKRLYDGAVSMRLAALNLTRDEFSSQARSGSVAPLAREIPYSPPHRVFMPFRRLPYSVLLESVKGTEKIGRYSFIAFDPYLAFTAKDGEVQVRDLLSDRAAVSSRPPLERLGELVSAYRQSCLPGLPPFQGGAIGMLSYDFVRYIERIPKTARDDLRIPDAHFHMADKVIAFDHVLRKAWIIVAPGASLTGLGYRDISGSEWDVIYDESVQRIDEINSLIESSRDRQDGPRREALPEAAGTIRYEMSKRRYMDMVVRAKEYIAAGDIFQANLSQRISAPLLKREPYDIYLILREINPSPFAGYADFGEYQIVSSSPERLVRLVGDVIETRPIAGTRPRGKDMSEDEAMRSELLLNEKERAEHIMLIDLERNDIGRVAETGSVTVDELMITEDYSHVIHIVSNVRGTLGRGMTAFDVVRATFPGGTITGVPKVRCMEIIDELEPVARGPYTGSLGYIGFSGNMDLNIIIRTFVVKDGNVYVQAGAGIVADSDPEREYYETLKKAEALIRTLELT
ncbi:MAG: anthranilate synthase component I family protein [Chloroflexota bacterium]